MAKRRREFKRFGDEMYTCRFCGDTFISSNFLITHMTLAHSVDEANERARLTRKYGVDF